MTNSYFRQVPNFEYVNRNAPAYDISNFIAVKNLFKRGRLRPDILQDLTYFEKYVIVGDDRPDIVSDKYYDDPTLDWVVLLSNNITNIQSEWPLPQTSLDEILLDKYGTYDTLYSGIHHYETKEIKDSNGVVVVPQGLEVASDYSITYWDTTVNGYVAQTDVPTPVTNYEYESDIENRKRNIRILKPIYLNIVRDDMKELMTYKKGGTQYVSTTLKKGENIKLYQ